MKPSEIILNNLDKDLSELQKLTGLTLDEVLLVIRQYRESLKVEDVLNYKVPRGKYRLYKTRDKDDDGIKQCEVVEDHGEYILLKSNKGVKTCILKIDLMLNECKLVEEEE